MLQIIEPQSSPLVSLASFESDPRFVNAVAELRAQAALVAPHLEGTVWMVNSTAQGGGVAEMLPTVVQLLQELGISAQWAVIAPPSNEFFPLTKKLHNLLHGNQTAGGDLGPNEACLLEAAGRINADELRPLLKPNDILFVHDPQPVALGTIFAKEGRTTIWRCHIGTDERNDSTRKVWRFLEPFLSHYKRTIFSAPEYIPSFLADRSTVVYPGLNPLTHKSRDLSIPKTVGILCNAGLQSQKVSVPTEDYVNQVKRVQADGSLAVPYDFGLLFRPIVLQISRWDQLKGFGPLLEGFVRLKARLRSKEFARFQVRNLRRLEMVRLVLAGPDPLGVSDDPEGRMVFEELRNRYQQLSTEDQADIILLSLPMASLKENALIVNALQRCASLVVQNSLREGFGLTVTEAMWKQQAVLGTRAVGIRHQIRDKIDGRLTHDPTDSEEISTHLQELITSPDMRYSLGRSAQRRVHDRFLVLTQLSNYLQVCARAVEKKMAA